VRVYVLARFYWVAYEGGGSTILGVYESPALAMRHAEEYIKIYKDKRQVVKRKPVEWEHITDDPEYEEMWRLDMRAPDGDVVYYHVNHYVVQTEKE